MADDEAIEDAQDAVPGAHRAIRAIGADEGPFAGALVTNGAAVAVRLDAAALSGWAGWLHAGSEHVAGPIDVVRRRDGQDVLLPWCTERISAFLGRRTAAETPLGSGEVGTLVASVLRGLGELGDTGVDPCIGSWWLTDEGRPLFVIGVGEEARTGALQLVERLREGQPDRAMARLLDGIAGGLQQAAGRPRLPRAQLERWEEELLAIAAPRPLRRDVHAPERVRDIEVVRTSAARPARSRRDVRADRAEASGPSDMLHRVVSRASAIARGLADVVRSRLARADPARRSRAGGDQERPPHRRRALLIGGAAAAAVLTGGLLWPGGATGDPDSAPAAPTEQPGAVAEDPSTAPEPATEGAAEKPPSAADDDPVAAAEGLLTTIGICVQEADEQCVDAVAGGSSGIVQALTDVLSTKGRTVEIVDEYGDVAVIRLSATDKDAASPVERMLVLVRQNEKWLVRDVYGVADQPG